MPKKGDKKSKPLPSSKTSSKKSSIPYDYDTPTRKNVSTPPEISSPRLLPGRRKRNNGSTPPPAKRPKAFIYEEDEYELSDESDYDDFIDDDDEDDIDIEIPKHVQTPRIQNNMAIMEYKTLKTKLKELYIENSDTELKYFSSLKREKQLEILKSMQSRLQLTKSGIPMRFQIMEHAKDHEIQRAALMKFEAISSMEPGSPEYFKMSNWLDGFMRIPFGMYHKLPVSLADGEIKCRDFMFKVKNGLDRAVFGQDEAKMQIMQFIAQWIANPGGTGNVLAIHGPAGVGKTTLIKEGVAAALGRPFHFIALGGATDSSHLEGHSYTYEGSIWGRLVDILISSKCMNPVIFFDELDKVSETPKGDEIINILMHLTDSAQNERICDKYFAGIPLDFSKCLFFFSMNDPSKINPILLDRAYVLGIKQPDNKSKITIARDYLLKDMLQNLNLRSSDITLPDETIKFIINEYTRDEPGVRELKRCLQTILSKINMLRFMNSKELPFYIAGFKLPFTVSNEHVKKFLVMPTVHHDESVKRMYT